MVRYYYAIRHESTVECLGVTLVSSNFIIFFANNSDTKCTIGNSFLFFLLRKTIGTVYGKLLPRYRTGAR